MNHLIAFVRQRLALYRSTYCHCGDQIARSNLSMLRTVSILSVVLFLGYSIFCIVAFHNPSLTMFYQIFLVIHVLFAAFACWYHAKDKISLRVVQAACALFVSSVMLFILFISIFPFPDRPAIFFPVLYITMILLFTFPVWKINLLMTGFIIAYLICVHQFKSAVAFSYDSFAGVTGWVLGLPLCYLITSIRIRDLQINLELKRISSTDELTGLPNRRGFNAFMAELSQTAAPDPVALVLMDFDDFKHYNDTYGHLAGDQALIKASAALSRYAAQQGFFIARYGGEEITGVLTGAAAHQAVKHAQSLADAVSQCRIPASYSPSGVLTMSIGVAVGPAPDADSLTALTHQADLALYQAKAGGKNAVHLYQPKKAKEC